MPNTQAYWDGDAWTEHYAPMPPAPATVKSDNTTLIVCGYLFALIMPIIGFVIGLVLITKNSGHGVAILVIAVVAFFFWFEQLSMTLG